MGKNGKLKNLKKYEIINYSKLCKNEKSTLASFSKIVEKYLNYLYRHVSEQSMKTK
jgi:hypothetical protein